MLFFRVILFRLFCWLLSCLLNLINFGCSHRRCIKLLCPSVKFPIHQSKPLYDSTGFLFLAFPVSKFPPISPFVLPLAFNARSFSHFLFSSIFFLLLQFSAHLSLPLPSPFSSSFFSFSSSFPPFFLLLFYVPFPYFLSNITFSPPYPHYSLFLPPLPCFLILLFLLKLSALSLIPISFL